MDQTNETKQKDQETNPKDESKKDLAIAEKHRAEKKKALLEALKVSFRNITGSVRLLVFQDLLFIGGVMKTLNLKSG